MIQETATANLSQLAENLKIKHPLLLEALKNIQTEADAICAFGDTENENFWEYIRSCYTVAPEPLMLNSGGVSPQPKMVQKAHIAFYEFINMGPSYYMWQVLDQLREPLRKRLADMAGCSPEEIAIDRNSTEALNSVIFGMDLKAGDEVILSPADYPNMMNAWKQREARDGIKLVWVNLDMPSEDEEALAKPYLDAFTDKTKVVLLTHVINWTGQVMPVARIAREARKRGIETIVDGAHSFALFDFKIPDLECDYFGTSLHKWLGAPIGSGLLYIRKEKIAGIWPLLSTYEPQSDDIRKMEMLGTRSFASEMAIHASLEFNEALGQGRKFRRLFYLKNYWYAKVMDIPGIRLGTSTSPAYSCVLGHFNLEGYTPQALEKKLLDEYGIHIVGFEWANVSGLRVTPHIFTRTEELDRLVDALKEIVGEGNKAHQ